jgi:Helix-turn-helix domain
MSSGEALFVLQLMDFKWGWKAPFPSYATIAKRMGISDKMARTHAKNLERSGTFAGRSAPGRTNRFDLTPLFSALLRQSSAKTGGTSQAR